MSDERGRLWPAGGMSKVSSETRPVRLRYFALLREQRGLESEIRATAAVTMRDLYRELAV
jgi:hypothetical protein